MRSKELLRASIERMAGLNQAQATRLIGGYVGGWIAAKPALLSAHR